MMQPQHPAPDAPPSVPPPSRKGGDGEGSGHLASVILVLLVLVAAGITLGLGLNEHNYPVAIIGAAGIGGSSYITFVYALSYYAKLKGSKRAGLAWQNCLELTLYILQVVALCYFLAHIDNFSFPYIIWFVVVAIGLMGMNKLPPLRILEDAESKVTGGQYLAGAVITVYLGMLVLGMVFILPHEGLNQDGFYTKEVLCLTLAFSIPILILLRRVMDASSMGKDTRTVHTPDANPWLSFCEHLLFVIQFTDSISAALRAVGYDRDQDEGARVLGIVAATIANVFSAVVFFAPVVFYAQLHLPQQSLGLFQQILRHMGVVMIDVILLSLRLTWWLKQGLGTDAWILKNSLFLIIGISLEEAHVRGTAMQQERLLELTQGTIVQLRYEAARMRSEVFQLSFLSAPQLQIPNAESLISQPMLGNGQQQQQYQPTQESKPEA